MVNIKDLICLDFLQEAEDEDDSGFIGAFRKLFRPKKAHDKVE